MSERFTHKLLHPDKVSDLMAPRRAKVDELLARVRKHVEEHPALKDAAQQAPVDDLFVLRFILSEKNDDLDRAFKKLVETLEWRAQRLPALIDAAQGKNKYHDFMMEFIHIAVVGYLGGLHPLFVVRAGKTDSKKMFTVLTPDECVEGQLLHHEEIFRMCDAKTRETGFLCKQISIIDLEGFSLFKFDPRFSRVIGKSSTFSATFYPQLLGKTVIINLPTAFRMIFNAMRVFMPASTLEKQAICPANTLKLSAADCPFLKKFANGVDIVPPFLGGKGPMLPEFELKDH